MKRLLTIKPNEIKEGLESHLGELIVFKKDLIPISIESSEKYKKSWPESVLIGKIENNNFNYCDTGLRKIYAFPDFIGYGFVLDDKKEIKKSDFLGKYMKMTAEYLDSNREMIGIGNKESLEF